MVSELKAPADDRFQVITEHDSDSLIYDPAYLDIQRSDQVIFIQITLNEGRTLEMKQRFYRAVAKALAARPGIGRRDVFINLVEVARRPGHSQTASRSTHQKKKHDSDGDSIWSHRA